MAHCLADESPHPPLQGRELRGIFLGPAGPRDGFYVATVGLCADGILGDVMTFHDDAGTRYVAGGGGYGFDDYDCAKRARWPVHVVASRRRRRARPAFASSSESTR